MFNYNTFARLFSIISRFNFELGSVLESHVKNEAPCFYDFNISEDIETYQKDLEEWKELPEEDKEMLTKMYQLTEELFNLADKYQAHLYKRDVNLKNKPHTTPYK